MIKRMHIRRKPRRGFTLTELCTAMLAGSTLMMLSVGMVHHAMNWSSISRQRISDDKSFDRLQRQFRRDAHLAQHVTVDDQSGVSLSMSDQHVVTYKVADGAVERKENDGSDDLRESYPLSDPLVVSWEQRDDPNQIVLSVKRRSPLKDDTAMPHWRHVEAVVGRMLQLQSAAKSEVSE